MPVKAWFPTLIYQAPLQGKSLAKFNVTLLKECYQIRDFDTSGRRWSKRNYPLGYTSYASLDKLHRFSSTFLDLEQKISRHVRLFARRLEMDLQGRKLQMTDCWLNIMPRQAAHGLHLHPLSVVSGTYYVRTPKGCPDLRFEDPRMSRFMATPPKQTNCRRENRRHIIYPAEAGNVLLFESWLRHEVPANRVAGERISISFNYEWA